MKEESRRIYYEKIRDGVRLGDSILVERKNAQEAKAHKLFWMADATGKGFSIDLLRDPSLIDSLFPGYGKALFEDGELWRQYFQLEFGPDSYLSNQPLLAQNSFRIAYSWTGCFRIYEKYGADVLVFGTSEVYKPLAPGEMAKAFSSFLPNPKVLYCLTAGMPLETIQETVQELKRISSQRPKLILWGYSYWLAYNRSAVLESYKKDKRDLMKSYLAERAHWGSERELAWSRLRQYQHMRTADFFPKVTWSNFMAFSLENAKTWNPNPPLTGNQEGIRLSKDQVSLSDSALEEYLRGALKPFYGILNGVDSSDCEMGKSAALFEDTLSALKEMTPNVFVYLVPTTRHHRRVAPDCFLPAVKKMLSASSAKKGARFLDGEMEDFGLSYRDFIYPMSDDGDFFFDINHTNFLGGRKILKKLAPWIEKNLGERADL